MTEHAEERIRARVDRERVQQREPEVRERGQPETRIAHACGEPGQECGLRRPGVGERRAAQRLRDPHCADGQPERPHERCRLTRSPVESGRDDDVDACDDEQRDSLPDAVVDERRRDACEDRSGDEERCGRRRECATHLELVGETGGDVEQPEDDSEGDDSRMRRAGVRDLREGLRRTDDGGDAKQGPPAPAY